MEINVNPAFWLCPDSGHKLKMLGIEILGDFEEDSAFCVARFLSGSSTGSTNGIAVPSVARERRVEYVYLDEGRGGDDEEGLPFERERVARDVEEALGVKVQLSAQSRSVNEMAADDRGALLRTYLIHKMLDEHPKWFRYSRDDDLQVKSIGSYIHEDEEEETKQDEEDSEEGKRHIRVVTLGGISVPSTDPSNISVAVDTATYRVKKIGFSPADDANSASIVANVADGSVYRVMESPKVVPLGASKEKDFLTPLEIRSRERGYLSYLRVGPTSLSRYWQLRAGIEIADVRSLSMVRVASLNCRYREFDSRYHPQFPGAESILPTQALTSLPVLVPFRSRVDRQSTLHDFLADLRRSCAGVIEVKSTSAGGEGAQAAEPPKTRKMEELVLTSALAARGKKEEQQRAESVVDDQDSMDSL